MRVEVGPDVFALFSAISACVARIALDLLGRRVYFLFRVSDGVTAYLLLTRKTLVRKVELLTLVARLLRPLDIVTRLCYHQMHFCVS